MKEYTIVKGASKTFNFASELSPGIPDNVAGSTIKGVFKANLNDSDAEKLFEIVGTIVSAVNGYIAVSLAPGNTNTLPFTSIYGEVTCKLSSGDVRRTGAFKVNLEQNLIYTLP